MGQVRITIPQFKSLSEEEQTSQEILSHMITDELEELMDDVSLSQSVKVSIVDEIKLRNREIKSQISKDDLQPNDEQIDDSDLTNIETLELENLLLNRGVPDNVKDDVKDELKKRNPNYHFNNEVSESDYYAQAKPHIFLNIASIVYKTLGFLTLVGGVLILIIAYQEYKSVAQGINIFPFEIVDKLFGSSFLIFGWAVFIVSIPISFVLFVKSACITAILDTYSIVYRTFKQTQ